MRKKVSTRPGLNTHLVSKHQRDAHSRSLLFPYPFLQLYCTGSCNMNVFAVRWAFGEYMQAASYEALSTNVIQSTSISPPLSPVHIADLPPLLSVSLPTVKRNFPLRWSCGKLAIIRYAAASHFLCFLLPLPASFSLHLCMSL